MIKRDALPSSQQGLAVVQEALSRGDKDLAHDMCVRLTTREPANEQAWLWRAGTSESLEETIASLSNALMLNPANSATQLMLYEVTHGLLHQDAFLVYLSETSNFYHIRTNADLMLAHPKMRAVPEPFPPPAPPPSGRAFGWFGWAIVGLIPAGLGALVCAPIAILVAIRLLRSRASKADRRRAWLVLCGSIIVWLFAVLLVQIFIVHLF
jgi:hypothetical protein